MTDVSAADRARRVRMMLFDVDGVLTDGTLYIGEHGEMMKAMEGMKAEMDTVKSRMDAYETATAMKKSNDQANESFGSLKKSENNDDFWKGSFLGINDL